METTRNSNRISDIVKLKQKLKKWRKQAHSSSSASTSDDHNNSNSNINSNNNNSSNSNNNNKNSNNSSSSSSHKKGSLSRSNSMKGITFLKRTLSFTDLSTAKVSSSAVPKGFVAVHVGEEMKRFVIPMNYLSHEAFSLLLKEAEEEFGFQQEGVLRIPCEVELFESILKVAEAKNNPLLKQAPIFSRNDVIVCGSTESQSLSQSHHPPSPMCR